MKTMNPRVLSMPHSGIREIVNKVVNMPDVIRLEIGQPSFNTPEHIIAAANEAAHQGYTGYTESAGYLSLRKLLVEKLEKVNGIKTRPDNLVVTVGAMGGIASAMLALCRPGDEVLIPDPAWPNYEMVAQGIGAVVRPYPCPPENGFLPDMDFLRRSASDRTTVLVLNSPVNPTGVVYPGEVVEELVSFARDHDLWIIGDEVYDQLVFERPHISPTAFDQDGRVISVFSFSKTYSMTGWRLGYVVAPDEVAEEIQKLQEPSVSCAPSISQKAAEAALVGPQDCVEMMRQIYQRRRDIVVESLKDHDLFTYNPQGAFYVLVDISRSGLDSRSFAFALLEEKKVAVAPGQAFGAVGNSYVRLSFCADDEALVEGLDRMAAFIQARS